MFSIFLFFQVILIEDSFYWREMSYVDGMDGWKEGRTDGERF